MVQKSESRQACLMVFGKRKEELVGEDLRLFRCAVRLASYYRHYERNKNQQRIDKRAQKRAMLTELGWPARCVKCGYDKYIGALDFHHRDPNEKDGEVHSIEEAKKCELLCANCHREAHRDMPEHTGGRPQQDLHPLVIAYLTAVGVSRPE